MKIIVGVIVCLCLILFLISYPKDIKYNEIRNIHRVEKFYSIPFFNRVILYPIYLEVEDPVVANKALTDYDKFKELLDYIKYVPYTKEPHFYLMDGANCQTMTIYLEKWCLANDIEYVVVTEPFHTFIKVKIMNDWITINFNNSLEVEYEYTGESIL